MKKYNGFSLLEMAFVILISGLIMTAILNFIPIAYKISENSLNKKKLEYIENAFYSFVLKNKRLPIPANITNIFSVNTDTFAKEQDSEIKEVDNFYVGMLPVIDLGLSPEYAYDGFNNKLVYIVNKNCTESYGILKCDNSDLLKINTNDAITEDVIFAIISQGSNKNYSFRAGKDSQKVSDGIDGEKYNSHEYFGEGSDNNTVYNRIYANRNFDDKVIFATKEFILNKLNMYDIGCKLNVNDSNIINEVNDKCSASLSSIFPTLNGIYYLDYREIKESDIYNDTNQCIMECGSFGKINIYKIF